jgi:hypothetical protein
MAPNYVQKFLDHANLSTTSRYLKVERQGMHAALKRFEDEREKVGIPQSGGRDRCTAVAQKPESSRESVEPATETLASKSLH